MFCTGFHFIITQHLQKHNGSSVSCVTPDSGDLEVLQTSPSGSAWSIKILRFLVMVKDC